MTLEHFGPAESTVTVIPVEGIGEVVEGADLAGLVLAAIGGSALRDGDVVVLTSKVVSKAEGRGSRRPKVEVVEAETDRILAERGDTRIVRTRHGLVMAGAGVDASNADAGIVLSLPEDPDTSAAHFRSTVLSRTGRNVAVLVTDTAGRAWREGQTDLAIGAAGLEVIHEHDGLADGYGNVLTVTAPAVADEIAAAADLVKGKLARRPAAIVRGLAGLVLPAGDHGPGARALVRPEEADLFGLGAREAVLAAVAGRSDGLRGFGKPAKAEVVAERLGRLVGTTARVVGPSKHVEVPLPEADARSAGRHEARLWAVAFALGWLPDDSISSPTVVGVQPGTRVRW